MFYLPIFLTQKEESKTIEIEATITGGQSFEIFINNKSFRNTISPNQRQLYIFENVPQYFSEIRIDPTDKENENYTIYRISFLSQNKKILEFMPSEINSWTLSDITKVQDSENQFKSTTEDPIILSPKNFIPFKKETDSFFSKIRSKLSEFPSKTIIIMAYLFLVLILFENNIQIIFFLLITTLFFEFTPFIYNMFNNVNFPVPAASESIGWINYFGYSKKRELLFILALLFFMLISGILISQLNKKFLINRKSISEFKTLNKSSLSNKEFFFIMILFFIVNLPNLQYLTEQIYAPIHQFDWDGMNVFTWKFLYEKGFLPYRDFWYPYGGQNTINGPFFENTLLLFTHKLVYFYLLLSGVFYYLKGSRQKIYIFLLTLSLCYLFDLNQAADRYLASFAGLVYLIGTLQGKVKVTYKIVFLGLYNIWIFFLEPHQLIYSFIAQISYFIFILYFNKYEMHSKGRFLKHFTLLSLITFSGIGLLLFRFKLNNQLSGLISFFSQTSSFANNASLPLNLADTLSNSYEYHKTVFILYFICIFIIGSTIPLFFKRILTHEKMLIYVGSIFLTPLLLKQFIRPHMAQQIIGIEVLILCLFTLSLSFDHKNSKTKIYFLLLISAGILGLSLRFIQTTNKLLPLYNTLKSYSELSFIYKKYFFTDKDIRIKAFFDIGRIKTHKTTGTEIKDFYTAKYGSRSFFVLGDVSILYVILNQLPPYTISFYDGSNIYLQNQILNWLNQMKPEIIIWDFKSIKFDDVPFVLKNSRIFKHIISNYKFDTSFSNLHFLVQKKPNEKIDYTFWLKAFGNEIDLKFLVNHSSYYSNTSDCNSFNITECKEFLIIPLTKSMYNSELSFNVSFSKNIDPIKVKFTTLNPKEIIIPLDQLWFWNIDPYLKSILLMKQDHLTTFRSTKKDFLY